MKRFYVYVDASVIGGCEDNQFAEATLALWELFIQGVYIMVLSEHTLRELQGAPQSVRNRLLEIPEAHQIIISDTPEADALAEVYLFHGILGPGVDQMLFMWRWQQLAVLMFSSVGTSGILSILVEFDCSML